MPNDFDSPEWAIELIPADDAGAEFYLKEYKPFRLGALQQDPEAFGSTYAREVAFKDEDWLRRLRKPIAKTFVVVRLRDRQVLSATSLFGPMSKADLAPNLNPVATTDDAQSDADAPLLYQLTGVYTTAEARGRGLGQAVMKVAIERAHEEARQQGRKLRLGVDVYATNSVAIAFYEKSGFVATGSYIDNDRLTLLMHYRDTKARGS